MRRRQRLLASLLSAALFVLDPTGVGAAHSRSRGGDTLSEGLARLFRAVEQNDSRTFSSFVDPDVPIVVFTNPGVEIHAYLARSLADVVALAPHAFRVALPRLVRVKRFPIHSCADGGNAEAALLTTCAFATIADMSVDSAIIRPASPQVREVIARLRPRLVEYIYVDGVGFSFARKSGRWRLVSIDYIGCDA